MQRGGAASAENRRSIVVDRPACVWWNMISEMTELVCRAAQRPSVREGVVFAAVAVLVASSAVAVKRGGFAPALAAVETAGTGATASEIQTVEASASDPALDFVAATLEPGARASGEAGEAVGAQSATHTGAWERDGVEYYTPEAGHVRYYNGRPIRPVRTVWMVTTAYSPDRRSCGEWADGKTASLKSVWTNAMESVAADTRLLPFGTLLSVPGYAHGDVVPVLDRGGAIKGARLDLLYPTHSIARKWGVQRLPVTIWEYAD